MVEVVWQAFAEALHLPGAGASPASPFNAKFQTDLLFLGDAIAIRAMDMSSEYSLLVKA